MTKVKEETTYDTVEASFDTGVWILFIVGLNLKF